MSVPKEQKVYRFGERNSLNNIQLKTEALPSMNVSDVVVKVKAAALNFRDIMISTNKYPFPIKEGVVPTSDFSGEVVAFGKDVNEFSIGDYVVGNFSIKHFSGVPKTYDDGLGAAVDGGLQEYVTLPFSALNKVSKDADLTWEEMASLVCTGVTCWNSLYGSKKLLPGQVVLSTGTGGVSLTALSIAKKAGAVTVITSSSDEKLEKVKKQYGIDYGVNYKTNSEWGKEIKKLTGTGAHFIIENGGSSAYAQTFEAVATGGIINAVGLLEPAKPGEMVDVPALSIVHEATVRGFLVGNQELARELIRFTEAKGLKIPVDKVFPFDKAVEAIEYLASGQHIGKVCIRVSE